MLTPRTEVFEYPPGIDQGIVRYGTLAYQVADTSLSFDGSVLRQLDEAHEELAAIDTTRPFDWSAWIDRGTRVVEVRQNDHLLIYTSIIDGATRLTRDILRIGDPDNWSLGG